MFKWVHISDLHFYSEDGANAKKIKEKLPSALSKIDGVNALFITGDFRYAKSGTLDVKEPIEYIQELCNALKIKKEQVYCVPGNHDLDRSEPRELIVSGIVGGNGKEGKYRPQDGKFDEESLQILRNGFSYFAEIEKGLYNKCTLMDGSNIHKLVKTKECNLLLLNTAITSASDADRLSLLLGVDYLRQAIDEIDENMPVIMIGHHGHSFFEREEVKAIQPYLLEKKIILYLCGHEHDLAHESVWDNVQQFSAGCIWTERTAKIIRAGFYAGEIDNDYSVAISSYEWKSNDLEWRKDKDFEPFKIFNLPCPKGVRETATVESPIRTEYSPNLLSILSQNEARSMNFELDGHVLLGPHGQEGIKYYWLRDGERVESLAFNKRLYEASALDENISAYTTSVSFGCVLSSQNRQCRFCETGTRQFKGFLTAEEIALQNIFMALYDSNCPSFPEVKEHEREFSFMGQGEPGYSYTGIRKAILLTDIAMEAIGQKVFRYIISTSGISDFMDMLIVDVENKVFKNRVSLHFSLHLVGKERKLLMPIENVFPYTEFIDYCKRYYAVAQKTFGGEEKIGVGIIAFNGFQPNTRAGETEIEPITQTSDKLKILLAKLDKEIFKIDLVDFNRADNATKAGSVMSNQDRLVLRDVIVNAGFDAKTFSSFGSAQDAGCGMLKSKRDIFDEDGSATKKKLKEAKQLLAYSVKVLAERG